MSFISAAARSRRSSIAIERKSIGRKMKRWKEIEMELAVIIANNQCSNWIYHLCYVCVWVRVREREKVKAVIVRLFGITPVLNTQENVCCPFVKRTVAIALKQCILFPFNRHIHLQRWIWCLSCSLWITLTTSIHGLQKNRKTIRTNYNVIEIE